MAERTVSKKQCYSVVIAPEKPWGFGGHTIMSTSFISYENQICPHWFFFSVFHHLRQLLLWSLVIKDKNVLSSKIKFRKHYWISNKNNNVTCDRLIFYYSSVSLYLIYTSFMFFVGSCTLMLQKTWDVFGNKG